MSDDPRAQGAIDDGLELLQSFRHEVAAPPPRLRERVEEQLWQQVLQAESAQTRDRGRSRAGSWWPTLARQGAVASVAAAVVVVLSFSQGRPGGDVVQASSRFNVAGFGALPVSTGQAPLQDQTLNTYPVVPGYAGEPSLLAQGPTAMGQEDLAQVPTEPAALYAALVDASAGAFPGHDQDFGVFRMAGAYLADPSLDIELRAGFVRMLAGLPGSIAGRPGIDVLGRRGVAVERLDQEGRVVQVQLLDKRTAQTLQEHERTTRIDQDAGCMPGVVTAIDVYDDQGFRITPETAPYANWPQVVAECG